MGNTFSVMISFYRFILNTLGRGKKQNASEPQDKFCTPPRVSSRASNRDFKDSTVRGRINSNSKCLPSRLKPMPLTRNPSQISLLRSTLNKDTPFRPQSNTRMRGSTTNLQNIENDISCQVTNTMNARQDDMSLDEFWNIPTNRNSNSSFDFHSAVEDQLGMSSNDTLDIGDSLPMRILRPGAQTSSNSSNLKNTTIPSRRFNSLPNQRNSNDSFLPFRTPSKISLNANECVKLRRRGTSRIRGSNTNLRNLTNNPLDFLESSNVNSRRNDSLQDFRHIPAHRDMKSAFQFHPVDEDQIRMQLDEPSECYDDLNMRNLQLRSNPYSTPGCSLKHQHVYSKIPVYNIGKHANSKSPEFMNFSEHHRLKRPLSASKKNSHEMLYFQETGDGADIANLRPDVIGNWIIFRNDTSMKFEHIFKLLSKKKHHSTGNIIDATTHGYWMKAARIGVDYDATMFKNFAGKKIVLTFGEYKFLIHKICTAYDLDYWDVLRKMATYPGNELHPEEGVFI